MPNLKEYYKGWPNSGLYFHKLNNIYNLLYNYLINFPKTGLKYTVIFDIDDTLVFTDNQNLFTNKKFPNNWIPGYMLFPAIPQMVKIVQLCKKLGFKVIILTARPYESEKSSIKNMEILNVKYDEMYHNKKYPDISFKVQFKKNLSKNNNIILSVGDQWPDIQGLNGCLCIKLPSYNDENAYYTFNNNKYYLI
jgi:hydroxymethylpyrimidine pyrophosphatase-like HAD family hydrolase